MDQYTTRIMRTPEVAETLGVSKPTLDRWRKSGRFPAPIRLGRRSIGWRSTDVEDWINSRPTA